MSSLFPSNPHANVDRILSVQRWQTACARCIARRGLTLVELLVVITILTMVTAATIPLMAPVTGQRKVRESARLLATMLAQAQSRALATGRPVGVWIQRLSPNDSDDRANHSIDLFLCESPPPYAGMSSNDFATVSISQSKYVVNLQIPQGWVQRGDEIRFNYKGPVYRILGSGPSPTSASGPQVGQTTWPDGTLTGANMEIFVPPAPYAQPPLNIPVPFQIFRQPVKTADEPATLPVGALVDLTFSGIGGGIEFSVPTPNNPIALVDTNRSTVTGVAAVTKPGAALPDPRPVLIMYGPSGNLASVHYAHRPPQSSQSVFDAVKPTAPVYMLVGQSPPETVTAADVHKTSNLVSHDNVWVAVNPQSGLVTTSEVAIGADYWENEAAAGRVQNANRPTIIEYGKAVQASRAFARSQQNMGGR